MIDVNKTNQTNFRPEMANISQNPEPGEHLQKRTKAGKMNISIMII